MSWRKRYWNNLSKSYNSLIVIAHLWARIMNGTYYTIYIVLTNVIKSQKMADFKIKTGTSKVFFKKSKYVKTYSGDSKKNFRTQPARKKDTTIFCSSLINSLFGQYTTCVKIREFKDCLRERSSLFCYLFLAHPTR